MGEQRALDAFEEAGIDPVVVFLAVALLARTPLRSQQADPREAPSVRGGTDASQARPGSLTRVTRPPRPTRKG